MIDLEHILLKRKPLLLGDVRGEFPRTFFTRTIRVGTGPADQSLDDNQPILRVPLPGVHHPPLAPFYYLNSRTVEIPRLRAEAEPSGGDFMPMQHREVIMPEPILKWAGGKRQILEQVRSCFPHESKINQYHEPYFGGGAIFFLETHPYTATINDINKRLMNLYWVVQEYPKRLIEANQRHEAGEGYYYRARDRFNEVREETTNFKDDIDARVEEASLLIYLNRNCYNGLYRENSSGEFNVPYGDYSAPDWVQSSKIKEGSKALKGVDIKTEDFSYVLDVAEEDDLVYFDPPYKPVSKTSSFVEYHHSSFGQEDQERLRDVAYELDQMGAHVVISNSPPMASLYQNLEVFEVLSVGARRSINSNSADRGEVQEILVSNVDEMRAREPELTEFA